MFATRLKELRSAHSLVQKDISRIFNVSMGAVGNWESGKRIPDTDTLKRIADYFNVSLDYLLGQTDNPTAFTDIPNVRQIKKRQIPVLGEIACGEPIFPEDVDQKRGVIRVRRSMSQNAAGDWIIDERTKTYESTRDVDCPPWLIEKLLALPPDYKPVHPAYITSGFSRAAKKRGLDIHFHSLRHYYASLLISVGAPDQYIMRRMGHTTPNMLHTVYGHIMADRDRQITAALNDELEKMQHKPI